MLYDYYIDPDITKAKTLPASFYRDPKVFKALKNKILRRSWQWIGDESLVPVPHRVYPFFLLDGFLPEPLILTKDATGEVYCLSNVCTHRGNLLIDKACKSRKLVCGYHGRRFALDGTFEYMPEFEQAKSFPSECDHLTKLHLYHWGPHLFTSLDPAFDLREILLVMEERIGHMGIKNFHLKKERSSDYVINAHWALYCDNYLEGFHIPFVHKALDSVLEYGSYDTLLFDHISLQVGYASSDEELVFDIPIDHVDHGKKVAAYYFWVFPNLMFNFYPWGLSVNVVKPVSEDQSKVSFRTYVYDESKLDQGAGSGLDTVEMEDEAVVESVQKGIQSGLYSHGRFSPTKEKGVHHFHLLLSQYLRS
ncbi:aromatic ring-hydroxylating dioxygenase subunit alpha [Zeaxanthinibacter sp. PT1]|uniref:aromatic ring-hydroxylating oxygenase subunit alpha n=1 Tax=Zeaxanthinibacter TaxID=561554 RepID=UPI00234B8160|nr:aromatic ring-hydroxylating dioxygenase subunit alpha [Zeaxanthinibacter sp. PT1]MDC6350272.1 aromatic ring-hydroxylating dioxygenase subunit alpha [Zeaxanthinibacter sp. PT1]